MAQLVGPTRSKSMRNAEALAPGSVERRMLEPSAAVEVHCCSVAATPSQRIRSSCMMQYPSLSDPLQLPSFIEGTFAKPSSSWTVHEHEAVVLFSELWIAKIRHVEERR